MKHLELILDKLSLFVSKGHRFLDLGCGSGELLFSIRKRMNASCYGIERDVKNIKKCMRKGLSVFQGNIEESVPLLRTQSYDFVILSQTLQEIQNPITLINEMLRIGKRALIIFPNFAYWPSRFYLLFGRTPNHHALPFTWFSTPNIRAITIKEFKLMCHDNGFKIIYSQALLSKLPSYFCPSFLMNFFSPQALFILESNYEN